ncbi:MAG: TlpA disulfide reductase family protein [Salibacter sp.]|uniref:TlpA family protein disulfide reductase n=1 Tax=Salibacter sp. TaxID=2010995 RepID=UPI00286FB243|nr:TlpA disulfide reductase family protein [Salibacter sp.]MDR9399248.1 TlpA disulfide reductase family protein [Salibacter sp.]
MPVHTMIQQLTTSKICKKLLITFVLIFYSYAGHSQMGSKLTFLNDRITEKESFFVLKFFATWCKPCIAEIPDYNYIVNKYRFSDIGFITISDEKDTGKVKRVLTKNKVKGAWAIDTSRSIFNNFKIKSIPAYVLIDNTGTPYFRGNLRELDKILRKRANNLSSLHPIKITEVKERKVEFGEIEVEITGKLSKSLFGKFQATNTPDNIKGSFKKYSVGTLIGVQFYDFTTSTVLMDTSDFEVNVYYNYDPQYNEDKFHQLRIKVLDELGASIDTTYRKTKVLALTKIPKYYRDTIPYKELNYQMTRMNFVFENYSNKLKWVLENNYDVSIYIPQKYRGKTPVKFQIEASEDWDLIKKRLENQGLVFEETTKQIPYLVIKFSRENSKNLRVLSKMHKK